MYALSITVTPTLTARVHGLLLRVPRLPFDVETDAGQVTRYELVTRVASVPFLISPLLGSSDDLERIYSGAGTRVVAISVSAGEAGEFKYYEDELQIRVTRRPLTLVR